MIVLVALIGLFIGVVLVWASDFLPRYSEGLRSRSVTIPAHLTMTSRLHFCAFLLSAVACLFFYGRYGLSVALVFNASIFSFLLLIALIDLKYRLVLNILTYPAFVIVVLAQLLFPQQGALRILLGGGLAFGIFFLTARLKPGDLGGGDVKLATLIGLFFGFPGVLWALIVGAGTGALVAIVLLVTHRDGSKRFFPYAPFLCGGAIVALLYSPVLLTR